MSELHTVHVRVNDAATGQPTPVRVRLAGADGTYYAPYGRLGDPKTLRGRGGAGNVTLNSQAYAYVDGTCEVRLPADTIHVHISKGFEFTPIRREVILGPGQMALRFTLDRWIDLRKEGWYSGDTSVFSWSPHDALLEGAAEDVAVINLLAAERPVDGKTPSLVDIPNILAFSGQRPALEMPGHLLVVNTCNYGGVLGAVDLLNCHRPVFPLSIGQAKNGLYDWTLTDWCEQCHRKSGLVLWSGFGLDREDGLNDGYGGEVLAALILGKIDAIEADASGWFTGAERAEWYRLLNCGLRVPLVGASRKCSTQGVIGARQTYARLSAGQEFTYKNWIDAIRAGRTFVTNGPLLSFTVNEQDPGAVIDLPTGIRRVRVCAEARSWLRLERLELVLNGEAIAAVEASGAPASALLEGEIELPCGGWLAARCWGSQLALTAAWEKDTVAAHTSPIYVQMPDQPLVPDIISIALLTERLDRMLTWVESKARFDSDRTKEQLRQSFLAARTEVIKRGGR